MDAWDTLLSKSTLGTGHDAWEHLRAQGGGSGTVIVDGVYSITYAGEVEELITYLSTDESNITYEEQPEIEITYLGEDESLITYVAPKQITMVLECL